MKKSWKDLLLCAALTIVLATLLIEGTAAPLNFNRPKGTSNNAGTSNGIATNISQAQTHIATAVAQVAVTLTLNWGGKPHAVTAKALLEQADQELALAKADTDISINTGN